MNRRHGFTLCWIVLSTFLITLGGFLMTERSGFRDITESNALQASGYVAITLGIVLAACGLFSTALRDWETVSE